MKNKPKFLFDPETGDIFKSDELFDPSNYLEFKVENEQDIGLVNLKILECQECIVKLHERMIELRELLKDYYDKGAS